MTAALPHAAPILVQFGVSDRELIEQAVRFCRPRVGRYRWGVVMTVFGIGSTAARALCQECGFDPDETLHRNPRRGETP